jgi:hypothetical protein
VRTRECGDSVRVSAVHAGNVDTGSTVVATGLQHHIDLCGGTQMSSLLAMIKRIVAVGCLVLAFTVTTNAQTAARALTNADIVKLVKAQLPESTISLTIQSSPHSFDTSPEALIDLKANGVPTKIIEQMLVPAAPGAAPSTPSASPTPAPAADSAAVPAPAASQSHDNNGAIFPAGFAGIWGSKQTRIEADRVFFVEGDKRLEMKYTRPATRTRVLYAQQTFAVLPGPKSRLRSQTPRPILEMILPNNVEVSSVVVLALLATRSNNSREILISAGWISATEGVPADRNIRIAAEKKPNQAGAPEGYDIYEIRPMDSLKAGEYAFMVSKPSNGDMGVGSSAKMNYNFYDFGVDS